MEALRQSIEGTRKAKRPAPKKKATARRKAS